MSLWPQNCVAGVCWGSACCFLRISSRRDSEERDGSISGLDGECWNFSWRIACLRSLTTPQDAKGKKLIRFLRLQSVSVVVPIPYPRR